MAGPKTPIQIRATSIAALALVLCALVVTLETVSRREQGAALAIIGAVGALILSALPAIARFSGRA
tara:strand:+ start:993 stop:1190 length:198 start_codon:yes stop_codon:yes gene_type:complete